MRPPGNRKGELRMGKYPIPPKERRTENVPTPHTLPPAKVKDKRRYPPSLPQKGRSIGTFKPPERGEWMKVPRSRIGQWGWRPPSPPPLRRGGRTPPLAPKREEHRNSLATPTRRGGQRSSCAHPLPSPRHYFGLWGARRSSSFAENYWGPPLTRST